jgi:hypothetical protein
VFITAVPNTKLCAWGEEDSGGHVLWDTVCVFITAVPNTKLFAWVEEDTVYTEVFGKFVGKKKVYS